MFFKKGEKRETNLIVCEGFGLESGHVDLFVPFTLLTERAVRQLASFVGHEVATLSKSQVFKVQKLARHYRLLENEQ